MSTRYLSASEQSGSARKYAQLPLDTPYELCAPMTETFEYKRSQNSAWPLQVLWAAIEATLTAHKIRSSGQYSSRKLVQRPDFGWQLFLRAILC